MRTIGQYPHKSFSSFFKRVFFLLISAHLYLPLGRITYKPFLGLGLLRHSLYRIGSWRECRWGIFCVGLLLEFQIGGIEWIGAVFEWNWG